MTAPQTVRLLPTLAVIAEELETLGAEITSVIHHPDTVYCGVRRYYGQPLRREILYVLSAEESRLFPVDEYAYVSPRPLSGRADHICCPCRTTEELLEFLMDLFLTLQETESRIHALAYQNASLSQLCALGEELLENAVFIHDSWFLILAYSPAAQRFMPLDQNPWTLVPQNFLDEFRLDDEYQRTYRDRKAELWESNTDGRTVQTLYVNLYDKEIYQGRLLVSGVCRPFHRRDYRIAELLACQALTLLKSRRSSAVSHGRGADDIMYDILNKRYTDASEFSALMRTLDWEKNDRFQCIRTQNQGTGVSEAMDHLLHKDLFLAFPGSYIMFASNQQCVVINLSKTPYPLSEVQYRLAPLCRDYCQYCGISSPVEGIRELPIAYLQAQVSLEQAFRQRNEHWIMQFYHCALDYTLTHLNTPMQLRHLVAPQLLALKAYDAQKDSRLFETFKTYLAHERDIPKTAAALIIHRTTLTYRLKKIASLMDLDLDDPNVRLYLQLSLKMLEQEKTVTLSEAATPFEESFR